MPATLSSNSIHSDVRKRAKQKNGVSFGARLPSVKANYINKELKRIHLFIGETWQRAS